MDPEVVMNPEVSLDPEVSFGPGVVMNTEVVSEPGGCFGTRRFLLDREVVLNPKVVWEHRGSF